MQRKGHRRLKTCQTFVQRLQDRVVGVETSRALGNFEGFRQVAVALVQMDQALKGKAARVDRCSVCLLIAQDIRQGFEETNIKPAQPRRSARDGRVAGSTGAPSNFGGQSCSLRLPLVVRALHTDGEEWFQGQHPVPVTGRPNS